MLKLHRFHFFQGSCLLSAHSNGTLSLSRHPCLLELYSTQKLYKTRQSRSDDMFPLYLQPKKAKVVQLHHSHDACTFTFIETQRSFLLVCRKLRRQAHNEVPETFSEYFFQPHFSIRLAGLGREKK